MFTITKISANNFTHFDGFKEMNFSNWEIVFNNTDNTLILQMRNGAPFPKKEVLATDVIIKNGVDGTPETFSTTEQIRARLLALNYNPLQSSVVGSAEWGGIGGDIENQTDLIEKLDEKEQVLTAGTNITIDRTNPLAPIINAVLSLTDIIFGSFVNGLTAKTTLVDADLTNLVDSADSNKAKKVTWLNVWNYIKGKADLLYFPLNPRIQSVTSSATVTPTSTNDLVTITAQAVALTLANPSGTFTEGQALMIRIKDNGTARAITFGSNYRAIGVTLPTTTVISKTLYLGIIYNSTDAKWDVLGINKEV